MPANPDGILDLYSKLKQRTLQDRSQFERLWYRSVLFQNGIQRIAWSGAARQWVVDTSMAAWARKAYTVTNKYAAVGATMVQMMVSKPPATRVIPGTDDPEDVGAAEVADRVLDVLLEEAQADEARKALANWMVYTGGAFLHPCWDPNTRQTVFVQSLQCAACGLVAKPDEVKPTAPCPQCGGPLQQALKPDGSPLGETMPAGKIKFEVYSPFEVYYDLEARSIAELDELFIRRRYPITRIRDMYGSEIEPDSSGETGLGITLLRALAYAASDSSTYIGGSRTKDETVTVDYVWKRPCNEYPEGLVGVFVGNILKNAGETDIPYENKATGEKLWPWYYVPFDRVPGRMTGRTPLDDVAPLQVQRNRLESLIMLITMRTAAPGWLVPRGLGITQLTGEPGQIVDYDGYEKNGAKPEQFPGQNVPTSLIARLEKIDADIDQLAGVYDVLRGNAPTGISAGTALRLLLERAVTRFTPALNNLEKAWEGATRDALCIFQQYATEERIKKTEGPGQSWEIQRFKGADLAGNIDAKVDAGSAIPKNTVGTQSVIQDLMAGGVINPQDPETQMAVLEEFGQTKLLGSADLNVRQAQREAYNFFIAPEHMPPDIDPIIDNHMVHIIQHKQAALQSDFMTYPPEIKMIWRQHIMQHEMAMAPPAPAGPPGGGKPVQGKAGAPESQGNQGMPGLPPSSMPEDDTEMPPSPGIM